MAIGARYCLMIEPFRDVNADLWPRMNVRRRDYFQGRIAELRDYRLEPVLALDGLPQRSLPQDLRGFVQAPSGRRRRPELTDHNGRTPRSPRARSDSRCSPLDSRRPVLRSGP
jgi:hypothetical protein